ncbi:hypothetical protein DVK01_20270 [Haloarcula sp. Atlit-120R]|nr:hypothetical protein DVK01_20270 [Haloarcula sp. Atlit-120R]
MHRRFEGVDALTQLITVQVARRLVPVDRLVAGELFLGAVADGLRVLGQVDFRAVVVLQFVDRHILDEPLVKS